MRIKKNGAPVIAYVAAAVFAAVSILAGGGVAHDKSADSDIRKFIDFDAGVVYAAETDNGEYDTSLGTEKYVAQPQAYRAGKRTEYDSLFNDMTKSHWACGAAEAMAERGMVKGYGDGSFRPSAKLTYGEFIKMMIVYHTGADIGNAAKGHWAADYYDMALSSGLFTENEIPYSRLAEPITRRDTALMIARTFENSSIENITSIIDDIRDVSSTDMYAREIAKTYGFGIMTGYEDGSFGPSGNLTRAEGVTVIYRLTEESARVYPGERQQNRESGSARYDGGSRTELSTVITSFKDYMKHPFYGTPVIYDGNYDEDTEGENPYKNLKYLVILDMEAEGKKLPTVDRINSSVLPSTDLNRGEITPHAGLNNPSLAVTKNAAGTEGVTFSAEDKDRRVVLVCGSEAYRMESYNGTRYWIPDTEDGFVLPKFDYVGFFYKEGDTLYLLKANRG